MNKINPKISGFTIIRNGEKLGYPYLEAIQSIMPICDEIIIVVGDCSDDTLLKLNELNSEKIKIIHTVWDESLRTGGAILAQQTNIALEHISGDWGFYIQGDEVVHEKYLPIIKSEIQKYHSNNNVEGLLFNYKHFYGSYEYVAKAMKWYRKEIRVIRNNIGITSYRDAQGFRKNNQKIKVKQIEAEIYHYGWCRIPEKQQNKQLEFSKLYHSDDWISKNVVQASEYDYSTFDSLEKFTENHPITMQKRISETNIDFQYDSSKVKISVKDKFRMFVEQLTGYRLWEYKNYKII